jgi:flagellar protein FliL
MSDAPAAANPEAGKKGGSKMMLIIILAVVLAGGGGGAYYFFFVSAKAAEEEEGHGKKKKSKHSDEEEEGHGEEGHGEEGKEGEHKELDPAAAAAKKVLKDAVPDDEEVKTLIELPAFVVNLADTEEPRYLRMTVSLGVGEAEEGGDGGGGHGGGGDGADPLLVAKVRNAMLAILGTKSSDQILTVEGKNQLRKELLKAARAASHHPEVVAIYITDFIVQL